MHSNCMLRPLYMTARPLANQGASRLNMFPEFCRFTALYPLYYQVNATDYYKQYFFYTRICTNTIHGTLHVSKCDRRQHRITLTAERDAARQRRDQRGSEGRATALPFGVAVEEGFRDESFGRDSYSYGQQEEHLRSSVHCLRCSLCSVC